MGRKKNLNISNLLKDDKKYDEKIRVVVGDYQFTVDKLFRENKIHELIGEMLTQISHAKSKKINLVDIMIPYTLIMMLKHFTSIDVPEELEKQIALLNLLIDHDLVEPISQALPLDQVEKTYNKINEVLKKIDANADEVLAILSEQEEKMEEEYQYVWTDEMEDVDYEYRWEDLVDMLELGDADGVQKES